MRLNIYIYTYLFLIYLFTWLTQVLAVALRIFHLSCGMQDFSVAACGIYFPDPGLSPEPLHWLLRVLATGPPEKFQDSFFFFFNIDSDCPEHYYHALCIGNPRNSITG